MLGGAWGCPAVLDDVGGPCLPSLLHTLLHSERAVERYTAPSHPTTVLQSSTHYSLYSVIQRCILYSYTAYTVYSTIQSPSESDAQTPNRSGRHAVDMTTLTSRADNCPVLSREIILSKAGRL